MKITIELPSYFVEEDARRAGEKAWAYGVRITASHYRNKLARVCFESDSIGPLKNSVASAMEEIEEIIREASGPP